MDALAIRRSADWRDAEYQREMRAVAAEVRAVPRCRHCGARLWAKFVLRDGDRVRLLVSAPPCLLPRLARLSWASFVLVDSS